ncbi:MAG: hypothetical protein AAGA30_07275, partial [Planctomycetota bacterium]
LGAASILALIMLATLWGVGKDIFSFYNGWLLCEPKLCPETRKAKLDEGFGMPNILVAIAASLLAIVVTWFSPLAAILTVLGIAIGTVLVHGASSGAASFAEILNQSRHVLGHYLTYGHLSSGAAGVWLPKHSPRVRIVLILLLCASVSLFFSIALQGFFPWDTPYFFRSDYINGNVTYDDMRESHAWVLYTVQLIADGKLHLLWAFPISFGLSFLIPSCFLIAVFYGPVSQSLRRRNEIENDVDQDERTEWQWYVDRIRKSEHEAIDPVLQATVREREHLFLGVQPSIHFPILLDKKILSEHAYIVGESGSGKTSLGIMPILLQLIRGNSEKRLPPRKPNTESSEFIPLVCPKCGARAKIKSKYRHPLAPCPKCKTQIPVVRPSSPRHQDGSDPPPPLVIIDLKGDPALFHTMRYEAETRQPGSFRWFTPEPGFSSHYFNPFLGFGEENRSLIQVAELLIDALGLSHGEGYGRSYFTRQNRIAILDALRRKPQPRSFDDLVNNVVEIARQKPGNYKDIGELLATLRVLTEYEQIAFFKPMSRPEQSIHMPSVLEERQTVYFWLPAALESVSVREIGKLALYALLSAAIDRQRRGKEVVQSYLFIDEFQRIAGENFKVILEQARSFGIGVILANQTASDLNTPGTDLRPTVRTNTRAKFIFSLSDPQEVRDVTMDSGEEIQVTHTLSNLPFAGARQFHESMPTAGATNWARRISQDDILSVTDHPLDFLLQISRGSGYTQFGGLPVRVRSNWALPLKIYLHRMRNETWPSFDDYDLNEQQATVGEESPEEIDRRRDAWSAEFDDMLQEIHKSYETSPETGENSKTNPKK